MDHWAKYRCGWGLFNTINMKDLYIIGCGGFAKEVYFLARVIGGYTVKAFINHVKAEPVVFAGETIPVIEEQEFLQLSKDNICLAFGIGDPKLIKMLSDTFSDYDFPNLIHPNVTGDFCNIKMGRGNILTANVTFTTCIEIGNFNVFNLMTTVGHDVLIGDYNVINPSVNISGGVVIGNVNLIGVSATILQYKSIGNHSIVGASSLVVKNVPDDVTVIGVPAKQFLN